MIVPSMTPQEVYREIERDNLCLSMHDGVLLGEKVDDIFVAHTFITYDMATGLQSETFEQKRSKLHTQQKQSRMQVPCIDDLPVKDIIGINRINLEGKEGGE